MTRGQGVKISWVKIESSGHQHIMEAATGAGGWGQRWHSIGTTSETLARCCAGVETAYCAGIQAGSVRRGYRSGMDKIHILVTKYSHRLFRTGLYSHIPIQRNILFSLHIPRKGKIDNFWFYFPCVCGYSSHNYVTFPTCYYMVWYCLFDWHVH